MARSCAGLSRRGWDGRRWRPGLAPLTIGLLLATAAHGDERTAAQGCQEDTRCQRLAESLRRTAAELEGERPATALRLYEQAYHLAPTSLLLWPMAALHEGMRRPQAGLRLLDQFDAQVGPPPAMPGARSESDGLRERLRGQLAHLRLQPASADVLLDGHPAAETQDLDPGEHVVEVRGEVPERREVRLSPGQRLTLSLARPATVRSWWAGQSRVRLAGAGALGGLFVAGLLTSVVLGGLDGSDRGACNYGGMTYPSCVYHLAPAYAMTLTASALFLGGAALVLFYPHRR